MAWRAKRGDGSGQIVREERRRRRRKRGRCAHSTAEEAARLLAGDDLSGGAPRWLSALRRQLPKLTEPHLAAALIDATLSVERIPASDGLPPAVGVLEAPKNTSRAPAAAAAALSLRALGALYPSYVAPLAAYLPALRPPVSAPLAFGVGASAMAKGGGLVAFYGRVRAMARGQHGAMCALAHLALRSMPPPGRDLAFARALLRACEELTKSLARAAAAGKRGRAGGGGAVARASVRGKAVGAGGGGDDDEVEGEEDGQARQRGPATAKRPTAHSALPLLTPSARPAVLLLLIAHLTTALESLFAPQATPHLPPSHLPSSHVLAMADGSSDNPTTTNPSASLRSALAVAARILALVTRAIDQLQPLAKAQPTTVGAALCMGCTALSVRLRAVS